MRELKDAVVVHPSWVTDSIAAGKRLPCDAYILYHRPDVVAGQLSISSLFSAAKAGAGDIAVAEAAAKGGAFRIGGKKDRRNVWSDRAGRYGRIAPISKTNNDDDRGDDGVGGGHVASQSPVTPADDAGNDGAAMASSAPVGDSGQVVDHDGFVAPMQVDRPVGGVPSSDGNQPEIAPDRPYNRGIGVDGALVFASAGCRCW